VALNLNVNMPSMNTPLIQSDGLVNAAWYYLFRSLYDRTGQQNGIDVSTVQTEAQDAALLGALGLSSSDLCCGINGLGAGSMLYSQTSTVTVANSVAETTLLGAGVGALTFGADEMQIGTTVSGTAIGYHSASGNPTIRHRVYLNNTVILDTGVVTSGNSTNATWEFRGIVTCRAVGTSGTVMAQGFYLETAGGANLFGMVNNAPITIDTTIPQTFNYTVQWGTAAAGNTISAANVLVQGWGPPV
jgi:hypothetical protein